MMKLFVFIIYCIPALPITCLQAQSYSFVHYDTKDGLASATVYNITQDKDGFIWFGTENGLCRFDGKNFKTFTTKNGLPDNSILKVHGDNSGRVYFTPFTRSLWYYQNDSFYQVPIPDKYKVDLSTIQVFMSKRDKIILAGISETYILENEHLISVHDKYKEKGGDIRFLRELDTLMEAASGDNIFKVINFG